jgi:hypothetical protein
VNIESPVKGGEAVSLALGVDYPDLRDAVRRICAKYPGEYWRGSTSDPNTRPHSSTTSPRAAIWRR